MNGYRVIITNAATGSYEDFEDGYSALVYAKALARAYGDIKVSERHGKRWFTIATVDGNGELHYNGKQKDYYVLPVDQYGQPSGYVNTVPMYRAEAIIRKQTWGFVYDNYVAACYRAMD